jgi:AcrR family transcriptional regulator
MPPEPKSRSKATIRDARAGGTAPRVAPGTGTGAGATALTKGDRTRGALLGAAIERFAREGYRRTSVADVCRDAQLSTTAAYPYFGNKEALFVAAVDEDVAALIEQAVLLVALGEDPDQWGRIMMRALVAHMDEHPLAGRILRGLEPEFTMRLLQIPALEDLRKTVTELLRDHQLSGSVRRDIDPPATANGLVVIVISLLMATLQTGADAAGYAVVYEQVAADVDSVLQAATRPPR